MLLEFERLHRPQVIASIGQLLWWLKTMDADYLRAEGGQQYATWSTDTSQKPQRIQMSAIMPKLLSCTEIISRRGPFHSDPFYFPTF